jgi:DNA-binding HxlR family transcriptional regulator
MGKRSYGQNCALARASDVIGERWTLLLVRDLLISPRRFNELLASEEGIGTNLLAARLKDLEAAGIVAKQPADGSSRVYALTERGRALEPAVLALIRWGLTHGPAVAAGGFHRHDWDLLALKAAFQPARAGDLAVTVQFDDGEFSGWVRIADRRMRIGLGRVDDADLVIDGTVADLFLGADEPDRLLKRGRVETLREVTAAFALRA